VPASRIHFHPGAIRDARIARFWYEDRSPQAARAFAAELKRGVDLIREAPERWPVSLRRTRRYVLHRFPYSIVYRLLDDGVWILAVAHSSRRPAYWKSRTPGR
jgi:plasmid stabilization system protein ParE